MGLKLVPLLLCLAGALFFTHIPAGAADRMVFCHYVIWNPTYSGTLDGFKKEIVLAQSYGIQAFALNTQFWVGNSKLRAELMYQAAKELGTGFKLFFSADFNQGSQLTPANIVDMLTTYKNHPNQLYYQGKQFLSTFLGHALAPDVWKNQILAPAGNNIFFIPFFPADRIQSVIDGVITKYASVIDGLFCWDTSAWPYFDGDYNNPSTSNDVAYLASTQRANKVYMASVSPWYFNHFLACNTSARACPSNTVMGNYQGPGLWMVRWNQLVQQTAIQLVEIITWNDWAERHYVTTGGVGADAVQPTIYDHHKFPHQAYLELGAYYISWFKTGKAPTITKDVIYLFYYSHSKNAKPSNDTIGPVERAQVLDDKVYVAVKLKAAATVLMTSGGVSSDFSVAAGVQSLGMPFREGNQSASIIRNGATIATVQGLLPITNSNFQTYDFNVYTTFST